MGRYRNWRIFCGGRLPVAAARRAALYFINDARKLKPVQSDHVFEAAHLLHLIGLLEEKSSTFRKTGGVHSAAQGDSKGCW